MRMLIGSPRLVRAGIAEPSDQPYQGAATVALGVRTYKSSARRVAARVIGYSLIIMLTLLSQRLMAGAWTSQLSGGPDPNGALEHHGNGPAECTEIGLQTFSGFSLPP